MFFCANAATFGPGLEDEPDFAADAPARPGGTEAGLTTKIANIPKKKRHKALSLRSLRSLRLSYSWNCMMSPFCSAMRPPGTQRTLNRRKRRKRRDKEIQENLVGNARFFTTVVRLARISSGDFSVRAARPRRLAARCANPDAKCQNAHRHGLKPRVTLRTTSIIYPRAELIAAMMPSFSCSSTCHQFVLQTR